MQRKRPDAPHRLAIEETTVEAPEVLGDDSGLSLEELAQTYANLMQGTADPYQREQNPLDDPADGLTNLPLQEALQAEEPPAEDECEVSPRSILEALLFVGHPENIPYTARQVAALMRGVSPREIDELVKELNDEYDSEGAAYLIASHDDGYRLELRPEFSPVREKFYGKIKEAKLSQGAVDVLAIVAYHQPIAADAIEKIRGQPGGSLLGQLIRRDLLIIERPPENPKVPVYRTTDRFLDLFGLSSLSDLPQVQTNEFE